MEDWGKCRWRWSRGWYWAILALDFLNYPTDTDPATWSPGENEVGLVVVEGLCLVSSSLLFSVKNGRAMKD